jgi:acylphosphatase
VSPVRHPGAPGPVHEPVRLQLSPVPAAAAPRPVVTDTVGDGRGGGAGREPGARLTAWVDGMVQGVGFRWWVRSQALRLGLAATATNLPDGRVKVVMEGGQDACGELLALLSGPSAPGRVTDVAHEWDEPRRGLSGLAGL